MNLIFTVSYFTSHFKDFFIAIYLHNILILVQAFNIVCFSVDLAPGVGVAGGAAHPGAPRGLPPQPDHQHRQPRLRPRPRLHYR